MDQGEFEHWQAVTSSSRYLWVEDAVSRLNGRGCLYYSGGESGIYMRITPDGTLQVGNYEGVLPHIGEALFKPGAERKCGSSSEAFQLACELGGRKFLEDMFSGSQLPQKVETGGMEQSMGM